jgi:hypothetical protein
MSASAIRSPKRHEHANGQDGSHAGGGPQIVSRIIKMPHLASVPAKDLHPHRIVRILFASLALFAILGLFSRADDTDVSGIWNLRVESPQGTANPIITLKQDGEKISGVYEGRLGEARLEGKINGRSLRFTVSLKFQDQPILVKYTGTVEGDAMQGSVEFGDAGSGRWSAKRRRD